MVSTSSKVENNQKERVKMNNNYNQETMLKTAEYLSQQGFSLQWLKPCSKQPIKKAWTSLPKANCSDLLNEYKVGLNLGCLTGSASTFEDGTGLLVFDVDIKGGEAFEKMALQKLHSLLNDTLDQYPHVISPRGRHYYARCPIDSLPSSCTPIVANERCMVSTAGKEKQCPSYQIEILSKGRQVVLPPSIHPDTKTPYQWGKMFDTYQDIPVLTDEQIQRIKHYQTSTTKGVVLNRNVTSDHTWQLQQVSLSNYPLTPDDIKLITQGVEKGRRSEMIYKACIKMLRAGMNDLSICSVLSNPQYKLSEKSLEERQGDISSAMQWVYKYAYLPALATIAPPEPLRAETGETMLPPIDNLGELGEIIQAMATVSQVPVTLALQSFLATASLLAQGFVNVELDGRTKPCSLNFITIAASGERKSSINDIALAPVLQKEKKRVDKYRVAIKIYEYKLKQQGKSDSKGKNDKDNHNTKKTPEVLIKPRNPQMVIEEPTYEALIVHLSEDWPSVGVMTDEAGRLVGGHAMNKDNRLKTIAGLSGLWDGKKISRSRRNDGTMCLYDRRVSCHLMMQPRVADIFFGDELLHEQGFAARCLICAPPPLAGTRAYQDQSKAYIQAKQRYETLLTPLLEKPPQYNVHGELQLRTLTVQSEAKTVWVDFYNEVEAQQNKGARYQDIKAFASKASEHALRLAGVLTLVDDFNATTVTSRAMNSSIKLMRFYLEEHLKLVLSGTLNPDLLKAERVLEYLIEHHDEGLFSLVEIYKNLSIIPNKNVATRIVGILECHHHVVKYPTGHIIHGERRREVWQLHPQHLNQTQNEIIKEPEE